MGSKKAGNRKDKCKRYLDSGTRIKNRKRKLEKWIKNFSEPKKNKIRDLTKIGRKREKGK